MDTDVMIFADGSSKGNPGRGGWGAIVSSKREVHELGGAASHTTNNRMELTAVLEALRLTTASFNIAIVVHTDSSYVINGITKWVRGWKNNGWVTKEKKEVLNRDLWEALAEVVEIHAKLSWRHVPGHVGVKGNERVDEIATAYAIGDLPKLYRGPKEQYPIDIDNLDFDPELKKSKSKSGSRSKAKAYSYVSLVDGKVMVHKTWSECEARVRGRAARFKKALSPEEEKSLIKDFSQ